MKSFLGEHTRQLERATYLENGIGDECRFIDSRAVNKRASYWFLVEVLEWNELARNIEQ